jgi:hypothetical protein
MNVTLRPEIPVPAIFVESSAPAHEFPDAMEAQWGFRPPLVAKACAVERNERDRGDDASFCLRRKRSLDDSLAHAFVHDV